MKRKEYQSPRVVEIHDCEESILLANNRLTSVDEGGTTQVGLDDCLEEEGDGFAVRKYNNSICDDEW